MEQTRVLIEGMYMNIPTCMLTSPPEQFLSMIRSNFTSTSASALVFKPDGFEVTNPQKYSCAGDIRNESGVVQLGYKTDPSSSIKNVSLSYSNSEVNVKTSENFDWKKHSVSFGWKNDTSGALNSGSSDSTSFNLSIPKIGGIGFGSEHSEHRNQTLQVQAEINASVSGVASLNPGNVQAVKQMVESGVQSSVALANIAKF
jgi:hypothetical protein